MTLNEKDLEVILDVLNVYDPDDISHIYPEMGEKEFVDGVYVAFHKVRKMLSPDGFITEGDKKLIEMLDKAEES